jgi:phosphatidylinositol mannoside-binding LppM-like protein
MGSARRITAAVALALLCTGCIKVDAALRLHSDDTVDGSMTYAVSKDLLTLTGSSADDLFNQVASGAALPPGVAYRTTDYSDATFVGKTLTFNGVNVAEFQHGNIGGETFSIQRVGDSFQVSGLVDLTKTSTGQLQPGAQQLAKDMQLRLAVTFPGPVQQHTGGVVVGNTVTWTPTYGTKTEIRATGSALGDPTGNPALWITIGGVVAVLIVAALVAFRRRRPRMTSEAPPAEPALGPAE